MFGFLWSFCFSYYNIVEYIKIYSYMLGRKSSIKDKIEKPIAVAILPTACSSFLFYRKYN